MHNINGKSYPCCTSVAMGIIGGKWKSVILYHLMEDGQLRYNELRKKMNSVTDRTLSLQLQQLQIDGLVHRKVYTNKPPLRVEYSLTDFGKTIIPVLQSLVNWGEYAIKYYSD